MSGRHQDEQINKTLDLAISSGIIIHSVTPEEIAAATAEPTQEQLLAALLDPKRFDFTKKPAKPIPRYTIIGKSISTAGNIESVAAQAKQGKTALNGAFIAAWMKPGEDFLGVIAAENATGALVHFDCEQSPFDCWNLGATAMRRAELTRQPEHFRSYCITELGLKERKLALRFELLRARDAAGSIFAVLLDGLADFCIDPNDTAESFELVAEMHRLAIEFDTVIFCVLHENEGAPKDAYKMRGHLGSQLTRKAETNLRLKKDAEGITTVFTDKARHCSIPEGEGPRFSWSDEHGMHMPCESGKAQKGAKLEEELKELCAMIFANADAGGMSWTWVHEQIQQYWELKRAGARPYFTKMKELGLIVQTKDDKWRAK